MTALGSDCCQGFYFAKPMLASSLDALIRGQSDGSNPRLPSLFAQSTPENGEGSRAWAV